MEVPLLPPRVSRVWQSGRILCAQNPQRQFPVPIVRELHPPSRSPGPIGPILHRPLRCHRQALDSQLQLLVNKGGCQLGGSNTMSSFEGSQHADLEAPTTSSVVNRRITITNSEVFGKLSIPSFNISSTNITGAN